MDTLELTWSMPGGSPGEDSDTNNPFSRATARLFVDGKPFPRLCKCFFMGQNDKLKWLGIFVHSAGDRVLFFPGFANSFIGIQGFKEQNQVWNQPFDFDHLTLEPNLKSWHATSSRSKTHLGKSGTLNLGDSRVLWFGMSVADENVLRIIREKTRLRVLVSSSDSKRRCEAFLKAREDAKFPIIRLNDENRISFNPAFIHFAVIVGPKGFPEYSGADLGFPFGSPFLATELKQHIIDLGLHNTHLPIRTHRVELSDALDIQITCCLLPGQPTVPVAFTSPSGRRLPF